MQTSKPSPVQGACSVGRSNAKPGSPTPACGTAAKNVRHTERQNTANQRRLTRDVLPRCQPLQPTGKPTPNTNRPPTRPPRQHTKAGARDAGNESKSADEVVPATHPLHSIEINTASISNTDKPLFGTSVYIGTVPVPVKIIGGLFKRTPKNEETQYESN